VVPPRLARAAARRHRHASAEPTLRSGASLTYTPAADYHGPDSFTFAANDGAADSVPATMNIMVTPVDELAKGGCNCGSTGDVAPLGVLFLAMLRIPRRRPATRGAGEDDSPATHR